MEATLQQILATNTEATRLLGEISSRISDLSKNLRRATGGNPDQQKQGGSLLKSIGKFAGAVGAAVGALTALAALPAVLTAAAVPFVKALNPGLVDLLNTQIDNLTATIGFALEPVIAQAAHAVREWAGALMPTVRELRPVIAELAGGISGYLTGAVAALSAGLSAALKVLAPFVSFLSRIGQTQGQLLETVGALVKAIADSLGAFTGLNDVFDFLVRTTRASAQALAVLAASALKLVGANETLARFRAGIAKRIEERRAPGGGLAAAPKDVGTSGIEDIMRKASERAFAATAGAAAARSETDLLEEILKDIDKVAAMDLRATIVDAIKEGLRGLPGADTVRAAVPVVTTVTDASATTRDRFRAGRDAGGLVGGGLAAGAGLAGDAARGIWDSLPSVW